ncbi:hypothetical protein LOTGIDRAFT_123735 [Lottia gigantea]|uniref:BPTI/Kunitz inhibitor domain-containing protein n=1 Tax=Lottia gigantea TaxID=225164 RepID=V4A0C9_LOTGI|nr:hypothetical protein LOTGIDRAFT_123735 [Lottia gigantea]ESO90117.1 hypothetical protein LOTGIDRAFT_123735 [Lottia gigantea]
MLFFIPECQQPIDPGTCNSRLYTRYAFDSQSQTCVRFIYSGCGGNKNRFTSRNACINACAL